jgi:hypothetical protein
LGVGSDLAHFDPLTALSDFGTEELDFGTEELREFRNRFKQPPQGEPIVETSLFPNELGKPPNGAW